MAQQLTKKQFDCLPFLSVKFRDKEWRLYPVFKKTHPPWWLQNEKGEGISLTDEELFNMINEYFEKEF